MMPPLNPNFRSSSTGQLVAGRLRRYSAQPARLDDPAAAWYVFDNDTEPARTVAVCPSGAADAYNVVSGLEILDANRRLVVQVFGVTV